MLSNRGQRAPQAGFSLVELMVALVIGLIVSGAAIALMVGVLKANAETIRSTRLTQELRVTAEVITRDLQRARGVMDPISNIGVDDSLMLKACNTITPAVGDGASSCIKYAYDCSGASAGVFRAVGLVDGKVRILTSATGLPACPASGTGIQLSSDSVDITGLTFTPASEDAYTIGVSGKFANDPQSIVRSISQEVRIKSSGID